MNIVKYTLVFTELWWVLPGVFGLNLYLVTKPPIAWSCMGNPGKVSFNPQPLLVLYSDVALQVSGMPWNGHLAPVTFLQFKHCLWLLAKWPNKASKHTLCTLWGTTAVAYDGKDLKSIDLKSWLEITFIILDSDFKSNFTKWFVIMIWKQSYSDFSYHWLIWPAVFCTVNKTST